MLSTAQVEFDQCYPDRSPYNTDTSDGSSSCAGWHEHDPFAIWDSVVTCIVRTVEELVQRGLDITSGDVSSWIKAVGITNQRETTVAWNDRTGRVYYNAIVWDCSRTNEQAEAIMHEAASSNGGADANAKPIDALRAKTGLPIASYFAGTKVRWLIDKIPQLQQDITSPTERNHVRFGTIDTWLLYMLTGYQRSIAEMENNERLAYEGGEFKTDVSNASRWLFMNLDTVDWDESLVKAVCKGSKCWELAQGSEFPVKSALPKIVPSIDCTIGTAHGIPCSDGKMALKNVAIASILGDQQAALFGQTCFHPGEAKCTFGTGLFLMMNTGDTSIPSTQGLLTTVAYQLGKRSNGDESRSKPIFALEGSVAFSGSTLQWLRDKLNIISSASEAEALATSVSSSENMYLGETKFCSLC